MRTYIHIGQHKTATTSIQHYLKNNRKALIEDGLYVPDSILGYENPTHFILNVYALNKNRFSTMKTKLQERESPNFFETLSKNLYENVSFHYQRAKELNCNKIIWTNEGLYLLNTLEEYNRLVQMFSKHSKQIICICCFREINSFRKSYKNQLKRKNINLNNDKDSYKYLEIDSWLFDYERKKTLLDTVFGKNVIYVDYNPTDMVSTFMSELGYSIYPNSNLRLKISKYED